MMDMGEICLFCVRFDSVVVSHCGAGALLVLEEEMVGRCRP